jgi:hypothetical protein
MIFPLLKIDRGHPVNHMKINIYFLFPARRSWRIYCLLFMTYPSEAP